MKFSKPDLHSPILTTLLALFFVGISILMLALWIHASGLGDTQMEKVAIYYSYLPNFMHNRFASALISMLCCVAAIILSYTNMQTSSILLKVPKFIILIVASCLFALNLFSLM